MTHDEGPDEEAGGEQPPQSEEEDGGEQPPESPPPEPTGPVPSPPDDLPTTSWLIAGAPRGALVSLNGKGVLGNAVDVRAPIRVLDHFERLVRIVRLVRSGLEVKRRRRLPEVQGSPRMLVLPATEGSYEVRLQLSLPEGGMVLEDHGELEQVVALLGIADEEAAFKVLRDLPERVGDELIGILRATSAFDVDLKVEAYRDGTVTATSSIEAPRATIGVQSLEETSWSEPGIDRVRGLLFRIDTKRARIAIDADPEDEEDEPVVVEAVFSMDKLEQLRAALRRRVDLEVSVREERRRYERTARTRTVTVESVRIIESSG